MKWLARVNEEREYKGEKSYKTSPWPCVCDPSVLVEFAENVEIHDYTNRWIEKEIWK